jgi:integrase
LFTGARLGELCQLHLKDVVLDTDIPFITITGDGDNQSVKNVPSERIVPLHKNIMQLDFKEYVTYLKKNGADRLFPELAYRSIDGYMRGASRWYSYEMDKANIMYVDEKTKTKKRKTFHCFRHTLPTVLDNLEDLSSNVISDVMGHTRRGTETNKTYIDSKKLTELYKAIEKLPYDFVLELAHWQK